MTYLDLESTSTPSSSPEKVLAMISHPVVALEAELATRFLLKETGSSSEVSPLKPENSGLFQRFGNQSPSRNTTSYHSQSSSPSKKIPPISAASTCQPLYARPKQRSEILKYKARISSRVHIEPIISDEMHAKLRSHLEEKIKGDIWQNEIRSRLARPLSATTFCDREEQLKHHLSAPQFVAPDQNQGLPATAESIVKYPFSLEAHKCTRQIAKCYTTMCFRVDALAQVRLLAIAIRIFRRRFIPRFVKWYRTRKAAAARIQKRYRRHAQWRHAILQPLLTALVPPWIELGLLRAKAKIVVVDNLEKLFLARKKRIREAIKRHLQLVRWAAKTKVCLFVHLIWCFQWFRKKRESNLRVMAREMQTMEQIDAKKLAEFQILFKTSMGTKLVKKELAAWRATVKLTNAASVTIVNPTAQVQDENAVDTASDDPWSDFDTSLVRLRNCFAAFDLDGSGTLDLDEFQLMISYLRTKDSSQIKKKTPKKLGAASSTLNKQAKLSTAQIRGLFEDLDEDGNGRVTCEEFEKWWKRQHDEATKSTSSSASSSFLSGGLDRIVFESHGLLFWLLGKKQQLERKFVKKLLIKTAIDAAKLEFLRTQMRLEASPPARRCTRCGRRFELQRDLNEHVRSIRCAATQLVVDTFVLKRWIREEEIRLLNDDDKSETDDDSEG